MSDYCLIVFKSFVLFVIYYCLIVFKSYFSFNNLSIVVNVKWNNRLIFSEFPVCNFKFRGSTQNRSLVGNKHISPFSKSINFLLLFAYPIAQPW